MKRIVKLLPIILVICMNASLLSGCSQTVMIPYTSMSGNSSFTLLFDKDGRAEPFAENLCVGENSVPLEGYSIEQMHGAGLFSLSDSRIIFAENMHEKLYPASLTKLLTALVAVKYGSLDQILKATEEVYISEAGAVLAGLRSGDSMTMEQALHLLLIRSANDVANLIAENISGSVEEFVVLMNEEAAKLGATNSNFKNPHGLHHLDHYTTVYDLYLIFKEVIKYEEITQIIGMTSYSTTFKDRYGNHKNISVSSTNGFFRQQYVLPENVTILGGKTGTTDEAGSCLALYVKDTSGKPYLSIILHGNTKDDLYIEMKQLLEQLHKK